MTKLIRSSLYAIISILFLFSSCNGNKSKQIEYFNISVVFTQDLKFGENTPIDDDFKMLINYQISDSCQGVLYVPEVTVIREDITPPKEEKLPLPLSNLNSWKPKNLIPAKNLKEDFDDILRDLKTPAIISIKSDRFVENSEIIEKYPNAIFTTPDKIGKILKSIIIPKLCRGKSYSFVLALSASSGPGPNNRDLVEIFRQIIDLNISPDERMNLIPMFLTQSFASNSTIEEFGENGTRIGITPTAEYFTKVILSRSINEIEILETKKNQEGKYWTVKIIEHHTLTR